LRLKKQKIAEKKFAQLKKEKNPVKVGTQFGEMADLRTSDPVTLTRALKVRKSIHVQSLVPTSQ